MKKAFHVDDGLLKEAKAACGASTDAETIRLGLELWCAAPLTSGFGLCLARSQTRRMYSPPGEASNQAQGGLMVLVDTSVWIRSLANRPPFRAELDRLLALDEVAGHELVYGELLIGGRGGRRKLLAAYEWIYQVNPVPHREVLEFVRKRDLHGRGVGWIDIHLLASVIVGRMKLWTADTGLTALAKELGVGYED